ncbi:hypothetical protein VIBNISFn27_90010 [Vibrio nigripulchritudo SFn27]|uniref:Uncharacterized protein n=1 Tax=Vibrio nigripulchritudo TaxID=28173 RepID=U4KGY4_9VIBR|nr:hypothetical protein [Vibrio nigripulchritudo]CCN80538.1 hypothetical protein VIBNIBLFn1_1050010 [Vibrio nigripulchritudo BLFn1]CCN91183.1 hypothetical protein VIBNISFn27_90010 [Vibrio nigripulchritudo SFn27]CCN97490.1 hypothetical protein VIBNIENn2_980010 [Vibrio nigripulchritudo ENn2]CCO40260.1 hypothetical protein VIBNISFn135_340012 [Vibrio nigripulchritudo SFn135]CCO53186.1 hypothetical protein VIBNIWn13_410012 [Vibrio nigripulchritudo Wn13]
MRRRRRTIWIPYGYRLKSNLKLRDRQNIEPTSHEHEPSESVAETQPLLNEPNAQHSEKREDHVIPKEEEEELAPNTAQAQASLEDTSSVAQFDDALNPYKSYVQDLSLCLTGMPKETFLAYDDQKGCHDLFEHPDTENIQSDPLSSSESDSPDVDVACDQIECVYSDHESLLLDEEAEPDVSNHQVESNSNDVKKAEANPKYIPKPKSSGPHLRRLPGIAACLLSGK